MVPGPLSLTGKRWVLHPHTSKRTAAGLVRALLIERELDTVPTLNIHALFPDMPRAVHRIQKAMDESEKIGIFGDYDCDGVTGTAQLMRFFARHDVDPIVKLPHRIHDGYGLHTSSVDALADEGVTLLITVDTGITAVDAVERGCHLGIDVIITDHHQPHEVLPNAFALLHPIVEPNFPLPYPSGAGVAHMLVHALEGGTWEGKEEDEVLAMIGTIADLVELRGANRRLVQRGLTQLLSLQAGPLEEMRKRTKSVTSTDVAFRIAPRINAAGRMDDPMIALKAILEGGAALEALEMLNEERQRETDRLLTEALEEIETEPQLLWSASTRHHPGIIGLLAGNLTERFGKPSCIVQIDGDRCTASLRSPPCYHITDGLKRCQSALRSFGGHAAAAGCTFPLENLKAFQEALETDVRQHTTPADMQPTVVIDAILSPQDITLDLCKNLETLEPYGQGNREPLILLQGVLLENARTVGTDSSHLQCRIGGAKAIGFGHAPLMRYIATGLDIICKLRIDEWQGTVRPQIVIEDARLTVPRMVKSSSSSW